MSKREPEPLKNNQAFKWACERWELRERKSPQCSRPFLFPE